MGDQHKDCIALLRGGLIVSCQALEDEPLFGSAFMAAMGRAAEIGGAVGIRANSPQDIRAIKAACALPVVGLYKQAYPDSDVYITPTLREIRAVAEAGADLIAIDATSRPRPNGETLAGLLQRVKAEIELPIVADISTYEEAVAAVAAGADVVSTTLSGYTAYSRQDESADIELVARLSVDMPLPVIAEGRIWSPEEARMALEAGAFAVVVGTAITRPQEIVRRYVQALLPTEGAERPGR